MTLKFKFFINFVCLFSFLGYGINLFADEPNNKILSSSSDMSADELLKKYKKWVERLNCCEYTFKQISEYIENGVKHEMNNSGKVYFNKYKKLLYSFNTLNSPVEDFSTKYQVLMNTTIPFLYLIEEQKTNSNKIKYAVISYKNKDKLPNSYSELLARHTGDESIMFFGLFKLGSDFILKDIYDSFTKMNLKSEKQQLNNNTIYKIIGEYNNRRYELWLNPEYEFMPIKISCCPLDRKINFFDFIIKDQTKIKDIFIPTKYLLLMESEFSIENKGKKETIKSKEKAEGEISNILLDVDFEEKDYKITLSIPDGTQADVQDDLQTNYIWYKGKIVVKTNEIESAIERGDRGAIPSPRELRFWIMLISLILIFIGGGLKIKSIIKNNKNSKKEK
ncbi:MAG: hypothetical protein LBP59_18785 [Planctomycetaceae bacterium]|jgi:hypothetical protein|nr:hypothetical protein [Planctomycetaceae bacterium]